MICVQCVMDSSDPLIRFDHNGVCNHCFAYKAANSVSLEETEEYLKTIKKIKATGGKYNCIIGVSGGLDSTYLLIHAIKDLGLRPLAVHIDNGWNTGLASKNIYNLCQKMGVDLETVVLCWEEFRKMEISILEAGVPDLEAPTDLFINYTLRDVANKRGIKYILSGTNPQTEAVMGSNWSYGQRDPIYLLDVYKRLWKTVPKKLPFKNWYKTIIARAVGVIVIVRPLKFTEYGKRLAVARCLDEVGWIEYPRKHGESFITRFYQNYFLPIRFGFDKRKAHLSCLILNGDIKRGEALDALKPNIPFNDKCFEADIKYFCTKLEINRDTFQTYMELPIKYHGEYTTIKSNPLFKILKSAKSRGFFPTPLAGFLEKIVTH